MHYDSQRILCYTVLCEGGKYISHELALKSVASSMVVLAGAYCGTRAWWCGQAARCGALAAAGVVLPVHSRGADRGLLHCVKL